MKRAFLTMALTVILGAVAVQARGLDVEVTVPITGSYDKINITAGIDVVYTQGSRHSVKVTGKKHDTDKVRVTVKKGELHIGAESNKRAFGNITVSTTSFSGKVTVRVTSPELRSVNILGSGNFTVSRNIKTDKLKLNITGSGDIDIKKVTAGNLTANIAGSGDIDIDNVAASCDKASFSIAGSGDIEANLDGCKNVTCSVAGSGDIKLKGKATNLTTNTTGAGNIDTKGLAVTGSTSTSVSTHTSTITVNDINAEP